MNYEMKKIKLETVYKNAYIDRYRRLGYTVVSLSEEKEDGCSYTELTLQRDKDVPCYERLAELENEVDRLCAEAREVAGEPDKKAGKRRLSALIIFCVGAVVMAAGIALVVSGLLVSSFNLAVSGWAVAIAGAVMLVVWSCLREKWRLRKIDILDDAAHPGFGIDIYSKKVEECLKLADKERSGALSH